MIVQKSTKITSLHLQLFFTDATVLPHPWFSSTSSMFKQHSGVKNEELQSVQNSYFLLKIDFNRPDHKKASVFWQFA